MQYVQSRVRQQHTNDGRKSNVCHSKDTSRCRTSSMCSICLYPGKNGRCSTIIENSQIGMSRHIGFVYQDTSGRHLGQEWKTQSFLLKEIFMVIFWQDCLWERQIENILLKYSWEMVSNLECLFVHREKGLFSSVYVGDIKLAGKKQNIDPMWKLLNTEVDSGEPTSSLDHVYLVCTQKQCETSKDIVDNYRAMFESRISAGGAEKLPFLQNLRISSWSYDMEGHAKTCVERYCELANKTAQQLYKVSTPCIDDHHFKEEELKSVGDLAKVSSQVVLKCLYLARIGRPDISMVSEQTCTIDYNMDQSLWQTICRLISYIHHSCDCKQYCHVGNIAKQCRLGLFQDSDFAGDLEDSKSASGGTLCVFGSHTLVPIGWMCKKQTSVSHNSTESEIISLDIGLRLDGISALDLWDLIVSVLGNTTQNHDRTGKPVVCRDKDHVQSRGMFNVLDMGRPVVRPMISNQNLRVSWKPVNPQDCVWKNLYRITMRTIWQEKETIHYSITIWCTNLFLCPKPWKFPQQRQQWTRNRKNWRKFRHGTWRKSEVRKRWSMKQGRRAQKFILLHWWTYVIWKMLNWRQSTRNTKVELYSVVIL